MISWFIIDILLRNMVGERLMACDEIRMALLAFIAERRDLPSGTTVLVMGVSAYMDHRLAVAGPPFAVVQIWRQTIMVDGIVLGHDGSFLKNIKGMFGRRTNHTDLYVSREYQSSIFFLICSKVIVFIGDSPSGIPKNCASSSFGSTLKKPSESDNDVPLFLLAPLPISHR